MTTQRSDDALVADLRDFEAIEYGSMALLLREAADRIATYDSTASARHSCDERERENARLRARVDLLEGAADFTKQAFDYMEAFIAANGGEDVRYAADLVLCASRLQSAVGKLAALDVATRSADTDGDEALRSR